MKTLQFALGILALVFLMNFSRAGAQNVVFPDDVGVIDITKAPYNADNTGTEDVRDIIQAALDSVQPGYYRFIYFPKGTYKVSGMIYWGVGAWNQGPVLIGEDRDSTIIKLEDNATGFGEGERRGVIMTGTGSADNFNNGIRNLTVNIGSNNPGACGIQFNANNEGLLDNVTITSDDGGGKYGLDMGYTDMIGPLLVRNLLVEGFETGVQIEYAVNSQTLSNITVKNQKKYGVYIDNQVVSIEGLQSINSVPAIHLYRGSLSLVNSDLSGGSADEPAIINGFGGYMYIKNTGTSGYETAVSNFGGNSHGVEENYIDEFVSHDPLKLFPESPDTSLNLDVKQPPVVEWESDLTKWVNIEDFGAVAGDGIDDTEALQAAIDACTAESGINTICLPNRSRPTTAGSEPFTINGTVTINSYVKNLIGCAAYIEGNGVLLMGDSQYDAVKIQNLRRLRGSEFRVEHRGAQSLIVEASVLHSITANGTGDLFVNDVVCRHLFLDNPQQKTWCRQLNMEGIHGPIDRIANDGADLWILGYKTEEDGIKIHTMNQGRTELMGYFNYPIHSEKPSPMIIVENAGFSMTGMRQSVGTLYEDYIMEIREGDTLILKVDDTYNRRVPLFIGYRGDATYYVIEASAGEGGSISPAGEVYVAEGSEKNFIITPEQGYVVEDVLVDGESMGAVESYLFNDISGEHIISASFTPATGIDDAEAGDAVRVFPNPAGRLLNIAITGKVHDANLRIYNLQGAVVLEKQTAGNSSVDVSGMSPGIYILQIKYNNNIHTQRIEIVNR